MVNILQTLPECAFFKSEDESAYILFSQIVMLSAQTLAAF